jgi:hypothetical protein
MSKVLSVIFIALLSICLFSPAEAQKRGSGSSKSSSSRKSSGSSVHVKGYFRKDGTYVQSHYRSRANGSILDNWSSKCNLNPYTAKIGTKDYPLGVWSSSPKDLHVYNTPFAGIDADFDASGLVIKYASPSSPIRQSWVVRSYRYPKQSTFSVAKSWNQLAQEAMETSESKNCLSRISSRWKGVDTGSQHSGSRRMAWARQHYR